MDTSRFYRILDVCVCSSIGSVKAPIGSEQDPSGILNFPKAGSYSYPVSYRILHVTVSYPNHYNILSDCVEKVFVDYCIMRFCQLRSNLFNPFPPRPAKTSPFTILLCLMPDDCTHQGRASAWELVNWAYCICPSLFLNPFPLRPAKTGPLLFYSSCLTSDNFTHQGVEKG